MLKTFPIDFIRQAFEQKLFEEHKKNQHLFGGKDQVNIFSFYEQLKTQEQVDRFVERYRDLSDQQNRSGLLLNGVLVAPENPTITNLYSSTIIPMTWTCSMRCMLADRDNGIITINNLIKELKGRKVDIAQLNCVDNLGNKYTEPFMVGTAGQGDGEPTLKNGDYIGSVETSLDISWAICSLRDKGINIDNAEYIYCENQNKLKVAKSGVGSQFYMLDGAITQQYYDEQDRLYKARVLFISEERFNTMPLIKYPTTGIVDVSLINEEERTVNCTLDIVSSVFEQNRVKVTIDFILDEPIGDSYIGDGVTYADCDFYFIEYSFVDDDGTINEIIFPPEHTSFEKYKVSFSFDAIRCDEPRNLNEREYCELSFGGSATLVNNGVKLGNDLLKVSFSKTKIVGAVESYTSNIHYLEPLEMPSGNSANAKINQLMSNNFLSNSHTDALNINTQYTFILDDSVELLSQWFDYARYGTQGLTIDDISPNIIYTVKEYWCSWGNYSAKTYLGKIIESIDIENTESDTLTLSVSFQVQGENN